MNQFNIIRQALPFYLSDPQWELLQDHLQAWFYYHKKYANPWEMLQDEGCIIYTVCKSTCTCKAKLHFTCADDTVSAQKVFPIESFHIPRTIPFRSLDKLPVTWQWANRWHYQTTH